MIWRLFMFKKLLPLLFLFAGFQVNAAVVFTYELNTSDWDASNNLTDGDTLTFSFLDGTDLNNITSADIFSYAYDFAAGTTGTNYFAAGWRTEVGDIGSAFSWDGFTLDLTFDMLGGDYIQHDDDLGYNNQVVTGQNTHIYSTHSDGYTLASLSHPGSVLTLSSTFAVPEPSIIALFGLGLVGLGFARRKRQL
jgi:hypothetical protein